MGDTFATPPAVQAVGWALVHFLWQGTLLGLATAIALQILTGAKPAIRYAVACSGLALLLAAPVFTATRGYATFTRTADALSPTDSLTLPAGVSAATARQTTNAVQGEVQRRSNTLLPIAVGVWMLGVAAFSVRLLAGGYRVTRLKRKTTPIRQGRVVERVAELAQLLGLRRTIELLESTTIGVPAVVGWFRPAIVVPVSALAGLPPAQLDAILAHELAHLRRHDHLVNALQAFVETALFYHPAVWWCSHQVRIEREHCCDDIAVEICGDRLTYATALTRLEEMRPPHAALALSAGGGRLIDRVRRVLKGAPPSRQSRGWSVAAVFALTAAVVTGGNLVGTATGATLLGMAAASQVPPAPPRVPASPEPPALPSPLERSDVPSVPEPPVPPGSIPGSPDAEAVAPPEPVPDVSFRHFLDLIARARALQVPQPPRVPVLEPLVPGRFENREPLAFPEPPPGPPEPPQVPLEPLVFPELPPPVPAAPQAPLQPVVPVLPPLTFDGPLVLDREFVQALRAAAIPDGEIIRMLADITRLKNRLAVANDSLQDAARERGLEAMLEAMRGQVATQEKVESAARAHQDALRAQLEVLVKQQADLRAQQEEVRKQSETLREHLNALRKQLEEMHRQLEAERRENDARRGNGR